MGTELVSGLDDNEAQELKEIENLMADRRSA